MTCSPSQQSDWSNPPPPLIHRVSTITIVVPPINQAYLPSWMGNCGVGQSLGKGVCYFIVGSAHCTYMQFLVTSTVLICLSNLKMSTGWSSIQLHPPSVLWTTHLFVLSLCQRNSSLQPLSQEIIIITHWLVVKLLPLWAFKLLRFPNIKWGLPPFYSHNNKTL